MNLFKTTGKSFSEDKKAWTADTLKTLFWALLIAMGLRSCVMEPFHIPSSSMVPSLLIGDYLFVTKYTYGYSRHSFPFSLPLVPGHVFYTAPERGDVVVFRLPSDENVHYIKRVIGLPGDKIQVTGGRLFINGQMLERELIGDKLTDSGDGTFQNVKEYMEVLPEGKKHLIQEVSDTSLADDTPVYTVPEGYFFMMGDNRDNSTDSRFPSVGYVPKENIIGKARFLFFSKGPDFPYVRWNRLFNKVK